MTYKVLPLGLSLIVLILGSSQSAWSQHQSSKALPQQNKPPVLVKPTIKKTPVTKPFFLTGAERKKLQVLKKNVTRLQKERKLLVRQPYFSVDATVQKQGAKTLSRVLHKMDQLALETQIRKVADDMLYCANGPVRKFKQQRCKTIHARLYQVEQHCRETKKAWSQSSVSIHNAHKQLMQNSESIRNKRQEFTTAFENFDQKANQLFNILSTVMKSIKEMRSSVTRNIL